MPVNVFVSVTALCAFFKSTRNDSGVDQGGMDNALVGGKRQPMRRLGGIQYTTCEIEFGNRRYLA